MFPVIPQLLDMVYLHVIYPSYETFIKAFAKELASNPIALLASITTAIFTAIGTWLAAIFKK